MRPARSTPYALLGMLRNGPHSGYSLRRAFTAAGAFWSESYGQIYPALRELVHRGWARRVPIARSGGPRAPRRHRYAITARGEEALRRWLQASPRATPPRNELLLKLYLGDRDSVDAPAAWVRRLLADETTRLHQIRRMIETLPRAPHGHRNLRHWMMVLEYMEAQTRATVAWCQRTLSTLDLMQEAALRRRAAARGTEPF